VFDPDSFGEVLAAALDAGDVACFQLALDQDDDAAWLRACEMLVPIVQARDVAFLLRDHAHLVGQTGADGMHTEERVADLRQHLPDDAILGAGCSGLRHEAMVAGEDGADYVAFGPWSAHVSQTLTWWQETMEPPCVAYGNIDLAAVPLAAAAGADFVMADDAIWNHPDGPAAGVAAAIAAIANASPH